MNKDSMIATYFKEIEGVETIFAHSGFAMYRIEDDHIYLRDIWTDEKSRHAGAGHELLNEVIKIGKSLNKTKLVGSVATDLPYATERVAGMLKSGFQVFQTQSNIIFFFKEI